MSNIEVRPTTSVEDRHYLCLSIEEYNHFANALMKHCYLNRDGQMCRLKGAKLKKLKNLRYTIKKSDYLMQSMIWKEQLRQIEQEIRKRQK